MRVAANESSSVLDARIRSTFNWPSGERIEWLSPVEADAYAEYYDEDFLKRLGVREFRVPLADFWPRSGPRWDALARTDAGRLILVEAKAHIEEAVDYGTRAGIDSSDRIRAALEQTRVAYAANPDAVWDSPFYQYANRLAHLHFLRGLNGIDAYLVFLYFAGAPDVQRPCSVEHWEGAVRIMQRCLGLSADHPYRTSVASVIIPVTQLTVPWTGATGSPTL